MSHHWHAEILHSDETKVLIQFVRSFHSLPTSRSLMFLSHLYEMNFQVPWSWSGSGSSCRNLELLVVCTVSLEPLYDNWALKLGLRCLTRVRDKKVIKSRIIKHCNLCHFIQVKWNLSKERSSLLKACRIPAGMRTTKEPWVGIKKKTKTPGNMSSAKMCWTTLTEINIAWAMCYSCFCVLEFLLGGRSGLPRRLSRVMTSSVCTRGTAILIWALLVCSTPPHTHTFFFQKGAVGKAAWQNPCATLSLSEEAHLARILTLQKSGGKSARLVPLTSPLSANTKCWVLWLGACVQIVLWDSKSTIAATEIQIHNIWSWNMFEYSDFGTRDVFGFAIFFFF